MNNKTKGKGGFLERDRSGKGEKYDKHIDLEWSEKLADVSKRK